MCERKKQDRCKVCRNEAPNITRGQAQKIIHSEIGPDIAKELGLTEETGFDSFVNALTSSGTTLQIHFHALGLSCFIPPFW